MLFAPQPTEGRIGHDLSSSLLHRTRLRSVRLRSPESTLEDLHAKYSRGKQPDDEGERSEDSISARSGADGATAE